MARLLLARLDIDSDGPGGTTKKFFFLLNKNDPRRDGARPSLADIQFSGMDPRSKQIYMRPLKKNSKILALYRGRTRSSHFLFKKAQCQKGLSGDSRSACSMM